MDRRESLKSILAGSLAGGLFVTGCEPAADPQATDTPAPSAPVYGRTPEEKQRDAKLMAETFFSADEMATLTVLCGLILPAEGEHGSAVDAKVPDFLEFIVKDMPQHQTPMRGGLMWLNARANKLFGKVFKDCAATEQTQLLDEIAFPDTAKPEVSAGVRFFGQLKNLVVTGYYTSEIGIKALGYQGNRPNVWDGVPEDVLQAHGLAYEPEWLAKCVDQEKRNELAQWDDGGNLI